MDKSAKQKTTALWLFRLCLILGLLIIPSIVPITWMNASLSDDSRKDERRLLALEHRVGELERRILNQTLVGKVDALNKTKSKEDGSVRDITSEPTASEQPSRLGTAQLELPKSTTPIDPLATRIQRRLALVETVIRWRRSDDAGKELSHHNAGIGVVHGLAGDLLVQRSIADPWSDLTLRMQRELAQKKGGSAQVLYRIWGSGLQVIGDSGKVNSQNAMIFDQALRMDTLGKDLVRLQNVGFPGEDDDPAVLPSLNDTVLGFRWPNALRAGLPEQTNPIQTELAFGVSSPSCSGCVLFNVQGYLIGHVDAMGTHQLLPGMEQP